MVGHKLVVEVVSANGLSDSLELLNPCVELRFAGKSFTTSVKKEVRCPEWYERTLFDVVDKERLPSLSLEAYVYNVIDGSQSLLGKVRLPGASFSDSSDEVVKDHQLTKGGVFKRSKGVLLLRVFLMNEPPIVPTIVPRRFIRPPVRVRVDDGVKEIHPKLEDGMIVEPLPYVFVHVVKARHLPDLDDSGKPDPYVEVSAGNLRGVTMCIEEENNPVWNSTFAFSERQLDSAQATRIYVIVYDSFTYDSVGFVSFDLSDIPEHIPSGEPAVPEWHRLIAESGRIAQGELMLAAWKGLQSDEAFRDSWNSEWLEASATAVPHIRSKVYDLPRLWLLRVHIFEFKCIALAYGARIVEVSVAAVMGPQLQRTKVVKKPLAQYVWDEELNFVAAEPFEDDLHLTVEARLGPGQEKVLGRIVIPLETVQRRVNSHSTELERQWFDLQMPQAAAAAAAAAAVGGGDEGDELTVSSCRIHLSTCLDGGYSIQYDSEDHAEDLRAAAEEIPNPPVVGLLEVGILGAQGLPPRRRKNGRSTLHPYCVARYGQKWVRTRTIINNCNPSFHEQCSWDVHNTATMVTIGVFDNDQVEESSPGGYKGVNIGKVRIPISSLQPGQIYCHAYPLLLLQHSGAMKMGELHLSVRFTSRSLLSMVCMYGSPSLPKMHYEDPLSMIVKDNLRRNAVHVVASRLRRMEPPLCKEAVEYMCGVQSHLWSMRRSKANFDRIVSVLSIFTKFWRGFCYVCSWENIMITLLAHAVFLLALVLHQCILPSVLLYVFLTTVWNYRRRPTCPPHTDIKLSLADTAHPDELDEEFDTFPTSRSTNLVFMRYDRLRSVSGRVQVVMGDVASCGERIYALTAWRDPTATAIFAFFTLAAAAMVYLTPWKILVAIAGLYTMRHPKLRQKTPSFIGNFYWRLPHKTDSLL
ncbi:hypothetical protein ACP4OV_003790 [Aristida adscensionis]